MKRRLSMICNLLVAVLTLAAWFLAAFYHDPEALLAAKGFSNLKFFTVLSNLFNGLVCLIYGLRLLRGRPLTRRLRRWKLTATAAVALTFLIVIAFLGPLYGHRYMYRGSNLFYHLLLPLLSMLDYVLLDPGPSLRARDTLFAALPALLYGLGYTLNLLVNGVGVWPDTNDFYGFLNWGWGVGLGIFGGVVLLDWLSALLLWLPGRRSRRSARTE